MKVILFSLILIFNSLVSAKTVNVILDPGHGGQDRGAEYHGATEAIVNLQVAKILHELLNSDKRFLAFLTRTQDVNMSLEERSNFANIHKGDLFLSLHANAFNHAKAKGVEFYFQNQLPPDEEVLFLASQENENKKSMDSTGWPLYPVDNYQNLKPEVSSIIQDLQLNSRIKYSSQLAESLYNFWKGVKRSHRHVLKQAPFHVISHVSMPANLIEMGYLTNEKEAKKLRTLEYQRQIANSLFKGLVNYKESMDKTPINDLN